MPTLYEIAVEALQAAAAPPPTHKTCFRCKTVKPLSDFWNNVARSDGKQTQCKLCLKETVKISSTRSPEVIIQEKEKRAQWRLEKRKKDPRYHADQQFRWAVNNHERLIERRRQHRELWNISNYTEKDRARALKKNYGLTVEQYEAMNKETEGKCPICFQPPSTRAGKSIRLAVDHNHQTGQVRGLLCSRCNLFVGFAEKKPESLSRFLLYLKKHNIVGEGRP